jgi:hypothetical protein
VDSPTKQLLLIWGTHYFWVWPTVRKTFFCACTVTKIVIVFLCVFFWRYTHRKIFFWRYMYFSVWCTHRTNQFSGSVYGLPIHVGRPVQRVFNADDGTAGYAPRPRHAQNARAQRSDACSTQPRRRWRGAAASVVWKDQARVLLLVVLAHKARPGGPGPRVLRWRPGIADGRSGKLSRDHRRRPRTRLIACMRSSTVRARHGIARSAAAPSETIDHDRWSFRILYKYARRTWRRRRQSM